MYLELLKKSIFNQIWEPNKDVANGHAHCGNMHSFIGYPRMNNIQECLQSVFDNKIPGDIMECGVWRGGATIFMNGMVLNAGQKRKVFVADSFAGLPAPVADYPADAGMNLHNNTYLNVSLEQVKENFARYDLLTDNVVFIKGFFENLDFAEVGKLALLRLDGDMYSSTINCLEKLYPKLQRGGFLLIDDWIIPACRKAVEDYREANGITDPITQVDCTGVWWQKS